MLRASMTDAAGMDGRTVQSGKDSLGKVIKQKPSVLWN